jgi:putative tryptophan/tyrosine transport system substrate-binding protein
MLVNFSEMLRDRHPFKAASDKNTSLLVAEEVTRLIEQFGHFVARPSSWLNRLRRRRRKALLVLGKAATDCAIVGRHHPSGRREQMTASFGRREFITLLGGAAAAWPLGGRAQQAERMKRIGVLMNVAAGDPEGQTRLAAFQQGLQQLGWIDGRNLRTDTRWGAGDADRFRRYAVDLVALAPDVILAAGSPVVAALQQATRTVPIVFALVADPVGSGYVASLGRPGGNTTGFASTEFGISGKWLELLKEVAPRTTRVAVLRDPTVALGIGQFAAIQSVAPSFGVELSPIDVRDAGEIEREITAFARSSNGGLIVPAGPLATLHRELIITLAARHQVPSAAASDASIARSAVPSMNGSPRRPGCARPRRARGAARCFKPSLSAAAIAHHGPPSA